MKKKYVRSYSSRRKATPKKAKVVEVKKPKEKRIKTPAELEKARQERLEKRRERDRFRRALKNSDKIADRLSSEDRAVQEIERSTQCGEGFGREGRLAAKIDIEILAGFADPNELENEDRICKHSEHVSKHDEDVADGEVEAFLEGGSFEAHDFRDGITLHDPRRPAHRLKLKAHPECEEDEVYLLNVTRKGFDIIRWETKRMGNRGTCGCYPVFVKRSELHTAGYRLMKPRQRKAQAVA